MRKIFLSLTLGLAAGCLLADWLEAVLEVAKFLASYLLDCGRAWLEERGLSFPFGNGGAEV